MVGSLGHGGGQQCSVEKGGASGMLEWGQCQKSSTQQGGMRETERGGAGRAFGQKRRVEGGWTRKKNGWGLGGRHGSILCGHLGLFTLGDALSFSGLTSTVSLLGSMLNFDAHVKKRPLVTKVKTPSAWCIWAEWSGCVAGLSSARVTPSGQGVVKTQPVRVEWAGHGEGGGVGGSG